MAKLTGETRTEFFDMIAEVRRHLDDAMQTLMTGSRGESASEDLLEDIEPAADNLRRMQELLEEME